MLYAYKKVSHNFHKLHEYVEHTVLKVWCKPQGYFKLDKLHPEFRPLVMAVSKNKNDYLGKPIRKIYNHFKRLSAQDRDKVARGFRRNNDVKSLCEGNGSPFHFDHIAKIDSRLSKDLNMFFKNLYNKVPQLASCKKHAGDLDSYYKDFIEKNNAEQCPFCGLDPLLSERQEPRDAFDHFLLKDKYPFLSVHPDNLAPACGHCNESYKSRQDPIKNGHKRRRVFFPMDNSKRKVKIEVKLMTKDIPNLKMSQVELAFKSYGKNEEAKSWSEIFGLDERYGDQLCRKTGGKYWYKQIVDECVNYGKTPHEMFQIQVDARKKSPLADYNFLRVPFLEACDKEGLFQT